jgi:CRP-like cAMP-binding protein
MTAKDLLNLHPFFATLPPQDLNTLLKRARLKRIAAGRPVFHKDDDGDGLYGVLAGRIGFTVDSEDGKALTLVFVGPGEFFGEIALLDGKGRSAAADAREDSELLFIPRGDFLTVARERPEMLLHIIGLVCARLRLATERLADTAFLDLPRRLAKLLVFLLAGQSSDDSLRISQAELASMLGVSRERVSRQLSTWNAEGILQQRRNRVVVLDRQALKQAVRGDAWGRPDAALSAVRHTAPAGSGLLFERNGQERKRKARARAA